MTEVLGDGRNGTVRNTFKSNLDANFEQISLLANVSTLGDNDKFRCHNNIFYLDFNNMAISFVFVQY